MIELLEKLDALKQKKILTDEEFQKAKSELLKSAICNCITSDSKKFDYILARTRTRETSTLTIATVAASASLLLLGVYVQVQVTAESNEETVYSSSFDKFKPLIQAMGVLFGIFGVLYRDVTALTIHRRDESWLKETCHVQNSAWQYIGREIILHILLIMPIVGWFYVFYTNLIALTVLCVAIVGGYIEVLMYLD